MEFELSKNIFCPASVIPQICIVGANPYDDHDMIRYVEYDIIIDINDALKIMDKNIEFAERYFDYRYFSSRTFNIQHTDIFVVARIIKKNLSQRLLNAFLFNNGYPHHAPYIKIDSSDSYYVYLENDRFYKVCNEKWPDSAWWIHKQNEIDYIKYGLKHIGDGVYRRETIN